MFDGGIKLYLPNAQHVSCINGVDTTVGKKWWEMQPRKGCKQGKSAKKMGNYQQCPRCVWCVPNVVADTNFG